MAGLSKWRPTHVAKTLTTVGASAVALFGVVLFGPAHADQLEEMPSLQLLGPLSKSAPPDVNAKIVMEAKHSYEERLSSITYGLGELISPEKDTELARLIVYMAIAKYLDCVIHEPGAQPEVSAANDTDLAACDVSIPESEGYLKQSEYGLLQEFLTGMNLEYLGQRERAYASYISANQSLSDAIEEAADDVESRWEQARAYASWGIDKILTVTSEEVDEVKVALAGYLVATRRLAVLQQLDGLARFGAIRSGLSLEGQEETVFSLALDQIDYYDNNLVSGRAGCRAAIAFVTFLFYPNSDVFNGQDRFSWLKYYAHKAIDCPDWFVAGDFRPEMWNLAWHLSRSDEDQNRFIQLLDSDCLTDVTQDCGSNVDWHLVMPVMSLCKSAAQSCLALSDFIRRGEEGLELRDVWFAASEYGPDACTPSFSLFSSLSDC